MPVDATTRVSLLILPAWFVLLAAIYFGSLYSQAYHVERRARHQAKVESERLAAANYRAGGQHGDPLPS